MRPSRRELRRRERAIGKPCWLGRDRSVRGQGQAEFLLARHGRRPLEGFCPMGLRGRRGPHGSRSVVARSQPREKGWCLFSVGADWSARSQGEARRTRTTALGWAAQREPEIFCPG